MARQSPVPPSSGSTQRTNLLLRALARRYLVDLVVVSHLPNTQERGRAVGGATLVDYLLLPIVEPAPRNGGGRAWSFASRTRKALSFNFGFREVPLVSRAVRDIARRGQYEWVVVRYLSTFAQCGLEALPNVIVDVDDLPAEAFRTAVAGRAGNPGQWLYNQAKVAGLALADGEVRFEVQARLGSEPGAGATLPECILPSQYPVSLLLNRARPSYPRAKPLAAP